MIRFRSYVITLVAVFLALAAGLALGAGPLSDTGDQDAASATTTSPRADTRDGNRYGDRFAGAVSRQLYDRGLSRRPVALVTLPGADPDVVAGLTEQIRRAGGTVTGAYGVRGQLLDPQQRSLVDTLGAQLRVQLRDRMDAGLSTYVRIGQLLGIAVANRTDAVRDLGEQVAGVRQSLVAAHLFGIPRGADRTAPLVLVVLGRSVDPAIAAGLLEGMSARARAVVAVGDTGARELAALRGDQDAASVATVDGVETQAGRIAATLALIRSWTKPGGSFGASGTDGAVPLG